MFTQSCCLLILAITIQMNTNDGVKFRYNDWILAQNNISVDTSGDYPLYQFATSVPNGEILRVNLSGYNLEFSETEITQFVIRIAGNFDPSLSVGNPDSDPLFSFGDGATRAAVQFIDNIRVGACYPATGTDLGTIPQPFIFGVDTSGFTRIGGPHNEIGSPLEIEITNDPTTDTILVGVKREDEVFQPACTYLTTIFHGTLQDLIFYGQNTHERYWVEFFEILSGTFDATSEISNAGNDPIIQSMDGIKYKYDGPCSYVLLTNKCELDSNNIGFEEDRTAFTSEHSSQRRGLYQFQGINNQPQYPRFSIISHHGRSRSRRKNVIGIKGMSIFIHDIELEINNLNQLIINDTVIHSFPYMGSIFHVRIVDRQHERKKQLYKTFYITINKFGKKKNDKNKIKIRFSNEGTGTIGIVSIPDGLITCGLMGIKNDNPNDDFKLRSGEILSLNTNNMIKLGDDWYFPTEHETLRCQTHPQDSYASFLQCRFNRDLVEETCDYLVKEYSKAYGNRKKIRKCFDSKTPWHVDETRIYDDCVTQICDCENGMTNNEYAGILDGESLSEMLLMSKCEPTFAIEEFKNTCIEGGVNFPFPHLNFTTMVQHVIQDYFL